MLKAKSKVKNQKSKAALSSVNVKKYFNDYKSNKKTFLIILLLGLLLLAFYKKSLFIAATVNGTPITNFELISRMNQQFRTQMLDQMVNEKLIATEARKSGVVVTPQEIDQKITQLEANVGGAQMLDTLLQQQSQTRDSLRSQLAIQISIEKLYSKEATVSAQEVEDFILQNKDQLKASDSAGQTQEATDLLKQQKLSQIFNEKFQQLKQSAKIIIF